MTPAETKPCARCGHPISYHAPDPRLKIQFEGEGPCAECGLGEPGEPRCPAYVAPKEGGGA